MLYVVVYTAFWYVDCDNYRRDFFYRETNIGLTASRTTHQHDYPGRWNSMLAHFWLYDVTNPSSFRDKAKIQEVSISIIFLFVHSCRQYK